ncbi:tail assembly protein (plasmid) [Rhizobium bangladeshense]|uniref:tail assembly protein n=1 Tax=Rhizobium bangladeshense TaxID=1138189 RepID=UPI001A999C7E|nr:tail assembly protein [Rhizobium bangladeshense]QSY98660.1 tail assembly protein [Rhizobium bangladeshense]
MAYRTIHFYGLAKKRYGASINLDVSSIAEAFRALSLQLEGFREFVEKHNFQIVWGRSRKTGAQLGEDDVKMLLQGGDIHVVPVLQGHKKGGLLKIIAGVFLLAAAFFVPFASASLTLGSSIGIGGLTYGNLAVLGLGLIAAGVSQMMTKKPKTDEKKDDSFMLDGQLNVTEQGGPVPVIYGRTLVGSVLISAGMSTVDIAVPSHSSGK